MAKEPRVNKVLARKRVDTTEEVNEFSYEKWMIMSDEAF